MNINLILQTGNPGIDITAVVEDAILNAEDAVGLDLRVQTLDATILRLAAFNLDQVCTKSEPTLG